MNLRRLAITFIGMAAASMASLAMTAAPASADVLSFHVSPSATVSHSPAALAVVPAGTAQEAQAVALVDMRAQPSPSARPLPGEGSRFSYVAFRGPDTMKRPADDIKDCTRQ
ncbi:hypothetical protein HF263_03030 [Rhizobium leguminosarum]|uniref:hypothetical protein n=1 Tax=Rhizobium leguminosarum TaxID=384 RepID=UPI001C91A6B3|nr:hypothetical protein [Rhizobium leguminosarum]MBY3055052.1 hypothetical protein [Rhizobium leguminosarum]